VVAYTYDNHSFSFWRITCTWLFFCFSALYLFTILIMKISKEQQSVVAIVLGLLVIALLNHNYLFLAVAGIVALAFPFSFLNKPVHKGWMAISNILGWISSHIILFILFYLFLTPLSLLRKLLGKKDMMSHFPGKEKTAFHQRNHIYSSTDFRNPW